MFNSLILFLALSTSSPVHAVRLAPANGRVNTYVRDCKELLDPGFSIQTVSPPLLPYASRMTGTLTFDAYGSNVLMTHEGPRREVQATLVRLNSGEIARALLGPSRGSVAAVRSIAIDADQILMQVQSHEDSYEVLDGKHAMSRPVAATPGRHYLKLNEAAEEGVRASPLSVTHPYFVTSRTRAGRFGRTGLSTRLIDWKDRTVVSLEADPRYLDIFADPINLKAQKLAVVEAGRQTLRLISMDAFEQCLRPEGGRWSAAEAPPRFDRAPVIELDHPIDHAFWLNGTTRLVTVNASGVSIWDGTTGQLLDAIPGQFESVRPIDGQPLLALTNAEGFALYAIDLKKIIETFHAEPNMRIFDREQNRTYLLTDARQIFEVRRQHDEYRVRNTNIRLDVDPVGAQIGAVETSRGTHLVMAGFDPSSEGRHLRSYQIKAFPVSQPSNAAYARTFTVRKDAPSALSPTGRHLVFGVDGVRVAIVDLKRLLETEL